MFRQILKSLGSLSFAIVLLSVIIFASAVGTVYETKFNADVAQKYIYGNWWFNIWLTALAVNLFAVAAIRYPWKRHQTGFVITHAGIITLLAGAMIDRMWGIEGFIHLYKGKPTCTMELHEENLVATIDGKKASTVFKLNTLWNEMAVNSPDPLVKIEIKDVSPVNKERVPRPVEPGETGGQPALSYTLQGSMMGRHEGSIFIRESTDMGPATIAFVKGMPTPSLPTDKDAPGKAELSIQLQGKQVVIPIMYGEKKSVDLDGLPGWKINVLGYFPNFVMNEKRPDTRDQMPLNPAAAFELVGPDCPGLVEAGADPHGGGPSPQDPKMAPQRERFFVFANDGTVMNVPEHGPATKAVAKLSVPNKSVISSANGVALYLGDDNKLRYLIKHTPRKGMGGDATGLPTEKVGDVEFEKAIPVGWAPGAELIIHELMPAAKRKLVYTPLPQFKEAKEQESFRHGVKCVVTVGNDSKELWVGLIEKETGDVQELEVAGKKVRFDFTHRKVEIPFTVTLKRFFAPRDEGSNEFAAYEAILGFEGRQDSVTLKTGTPMALARGTTLLIGAICDENDDAIEFLPKFDQSVTIDQNETTRVEIRAERNKDYPGFDGRQDTVELKPDSPTAKLLGTTRISGLQMDDNAQSMEFTVKQVMIEKKDIQNITKLTQKISMNRPTTFPVSWYGPWLGTCYKFSQANHQIIPSIPSESDPDYSGVQVLRDPGWLLKWVGCLMICFGIFTMFYLRPYFNRPKEPLKAVAQTAGEDSDAKKKKKKI